VRSFRALGAEEARGLVERGAELIVVGTPRTVRTVPGARLLAPGDPLPELPADGVAVVIVAAEDGQGYALAARLVRAGIRGVAVVEGGLAAWRGTALAGGEPLDDVDG